MKQRNHMRTPEEKEIIIKDYLSGTGIRKIENKYNVRNANFYRWLKKYQENGLDGLKSNTGKTSKHHNHMGIHFKKPKNREQELELELIKKDIEIARLKKGYFVKGVGHRKEYVTTLEKNMR